MLQGGNENCLLSQQLMMHPELVPLLVIVNRTGEAPGMTHTDWDADNQELTRVNRSSRRQIRVSINHTTTNQTTAVREQGSEERI